MFGIGTTELIIILLVALIVLGPTKLPGIARSLGKALGEFRRVTTDVQRTFNLEAARIEEEEKVKASPTPKPEQKAESTPGPTSAPKPKAADIPPPDAVDPNPSAAQQVAASEARAAESASNPADEKSKAEAKA